ncbi:hypothetical protein [Kineosporia succinea]|uniref:Uncharacterized protein n=1 Tax=Kineosporia succinea TaxID=84632 RepID=A0ABT9P0A2_9ACTN|nr:hypothetical protein [Kineosporia succinea]MDP9826107.1 hypothetical protein [Kineosporia succinea]
MDSRMGGRRYSVSTDLSAKRDRTPTIDLTWRGKVVTDRADSAEPEEAWRAEVTEGFTGALEVRMAVISSVVMLATTTNDGPSLNSNGVVEWGVKNIIPLVLLVIGIGIIASARKGRISDNANTLTNVVLGMGVIAGAAVLYGFAGQLTSLVFGDG